MIRFYRPLWMFAAFAAFMILLPTPRLYAGEKKSRPPNIIFIVADAAAARSEI